MRLRRRRPSLLDVAAASRFQLFQLQPPRLDLSLFGSDLLVEHLFRVLDQRENILSLHISEIRRFHRPPLMPNFTGTVSEGQIVELVAYLKSLTTDPDGSAKGASQ
jgi:hypothetical protein